LAQQLPLGLKSRHVEEFRECRLTDVAESELGKEETSGQSIMTEGRITPAHE